MPKGYVISIEDIRDRAAVDAYVGKAVPTIMKAGGRPIVVEDAADVLEGDWPGGRTVILEFESVDAARAWYNSSDYQPLISERQGAASSIVAIVSGFEMPGGGPTS